MKIYGTKEDFYNDCLTSEKDKMVIPFAVYSEEDGEFLGYIKEYID